MKSAVAILLVCLTFALVSARRLRDTQSCKIWGQEPSIDLWFTQNDATFQQRYWANTTFWQPGQPIFLVFAGEAPLEDFYGVTDNIIVSMAQSHSAAVLYLEHRFYGQSVPNNDLSTENMRFLSVQQALADGAEFVSVFMNEQKSENSKVVVFGCSYSGEMAAFFRIRYPNIAIAAVAGSAPVQALLNFEGYDQMVASVAGAACSNVIHSALDQIAAQLNTADGRQALIKAYQPCEQKFDDTNFVFALQGLVMGAVQGNNADAGYPAKTMCQALLSVADPVASFQAWAVPQLGGECMETDFITPMTVNLTTAGQYSGSRSWWYQTCTEFGYFQTTTGTDVFGTALPINTSYYLNACAGIFGKPLTPRIDEVNWTFGAKHPAGTHILFTNGMQDPWSVLGIKEDVSKTETVALYTGAHCAPFHASSDLDPQDLIQARKTMIAFVQEVLSM